MKSLKRFFARLRNSAAQRRSDERLREEMQEHLVLQTEENIRAGMSPVEAHRHARLKFGAVEAIREDYHAEKGLPLLENLLHDTRFAWRILRKSPGFTIIALLTLALGIGATTALFSVVDAVVLKPLPFPSADRLVHIESVIEVTGHGDVASYPDFLDWRARNHVTDGMAAFRTGDFTLIGPREPVHLQGAVVSAQLFSLLGVTPELGRSFLPEEDNPAAAGGVDPVILSYGLWQREFGADVSVLNRTIQLGDQRFIVVGVMPKAFQYPIQVEPIELWTTIAVDVRGGAYAMTTQRGAHYLDVVALLKPGVTLQQAQAEFAAIASVLNKQHPENKPRTVRLVPELQLLTGPVRTPLLLLLGAVGCVLLMVCANIANLLLMRATGRRKEMAVRIALGASGRRVTCQLLAESMLLGLLGGALGLALALLSIRFLVKIMPVDIPRLNTIGLDARLLGFALLISLLAGILFGVAPALQASKVSLTESLKKSGRGTGGEDKGRLRAALAVSEIALAVVLLLGAGLLLQSFFHLMHIDPGFNSQHVLTFQLDAPGGPGSAQVPAFFRDAVARVRALPGVSSASAAASLPLTGDNIGGSFEIEGQPTPMGSRPSADFNAVEPNYFHTIGTALISGRDFTPQDNSKSTPVVIVNRTLMRLFFSNQYPIGKSLRPGIANGYGPGEAPMREIVGVIEDIKQSRPGAEAAPEIYAPLAQSPFDTMFIVARTANDPASIVQAARRQIASLNKNLPIYHVKTLHQYFADSVAEPRIISLLLSGFASLAVLLACLGVYGVVSYAVIERTHEIGVRMALGADRSKVVHWILLKGLLLALAGITIGLAGSFALVHLVSSLLFGVRATDPMTFAAGTVAVLSVAGLASYIPARRAAKVNPMVALRHE